MHMCYNQWSVGSGSGIGVGCLFLGTDYSYIQGKCVSCCFLVGTSGLMMLMDDGNLFSECAV